LDTLIRKAIVMFGINKVFRAKKRLSPLYHPGSCGVYRQNILYRIFPEAKNVLPRKGEVIGIFPPYKPPFAVLFNAISSRDKAIAA
jgi:hypothetical protein